ncbi:hypothetical protein GRF29_103g1622721 [Pseudopithomyces chartarum]|uniref:Uncharacterized protein n=1 Tax=Pseudopithomyces chartarum TaxID=1892770 RepID=A0AAN6LUN8_9PLEO|nr:hypothetical protein GRF29_103g1622721 [Pseudopithomyces chartarum]
MELKDKYEDCYGDKGERFAKGDAIAHASLVETLVKFNTGLVRIIAKFLHHDSKNSDLRLDYKSLTHLSDASRREALDSMHKLYQRLTLSQMQLVRKPSPKPDSDKKRRSSSRQRSQGPTVTRVAIKSPGSATQTQLAMLELVLLPHDLHDLDADALPLPSPQVPPSPGIHTRGSVSLSPICQTHRSSEETPPLIRHHPALEIQTRVHDYAADATGVLRSPQHAASSTASFFGWEPRGETEGGEGDPVDVYVCVG